MKISVQLLVILVCPEISMQKITMQVKTKKTKLPVKWMAPECLEKGNYNSQSDVVSFQIDSHHFQLFFRDSSRGRIECTETHSNHQY